MAFCCSSADQPRAPCADKLACARFPGALKRVPGVVGAPRCGIGELGSSASCRRLCWRAATSGGSWAARRQRRRCSSSRDQQVVLAAAQAARSQARSLQRGSSGVVYVWNSPNVCAQGASVDGDPKMVKLTGMGSGGDIPALRGLISQLFGPVSAVTSAEPSPGQLVAFVTFATAEVRFCCAVVAIVSVLRTPLTAHRLPNHSPARRKCRPRGRAEPQRQQAQVFAHLRRGWWSRDRTNQRCAPVQPAH